MRLSAGLTVSILVFAMGGCGTRIVVVPADHQVKWLAPGQCYCATNDGRWLVPDAAMQVLLRSANRQANGL